ncbi:MAG TPA: hypothetical protein QGF58_06950, partial [Myxococcota bacterium]|nr:hypothetical protein [Myxococcota bacterium]
TDTDVGTLDEPGDYANVFSGEDLEIDLSDVSGDSNRDQDFYLVVINEETEDVGWRVHYSPVSSGGPPPVAERVSQVSTKATTVANKEARPFVKASPPPQPPYSESDVGGSESEFHIRNDFEDRKSYTVVTATLWAVGTNVTIWVDNDHAIDWDYDCNGIVDEADSRGAYGFDNCDLQAVADVVDTNIVTNIDATFGEPSDINGDEQVTVVISPVLNSLPLSSEDEDDWNNVVGSYASPSVDLQDFDEANNPGSDMQEIMYVFAPDPHGFANVYHPVAIEEYTSMALQAEIARSYLKLVLYNQRLIAPEEEGETPGSVEDDWLIEGLGTVAADQCGFGAYYFVDAWLHLDAPYLYTLTEYELEGFGSSIPKGGQYLFVRWLVDVYGESILGSLTVTTDTGVDNVEAATEEDFATLVRQWQVAMLTSAVTKEDGSALVDSAVWPQYAEAEILSAPTTAPSPPTPGVYYGANGYQRGFNIRGANLWMDGGTTADPEEIKDLRVVGEGPDFHSHLPGFAMYGYTAGGYGAHVIRLTGLDYDQTKVEILGDSALTLAATVVRWNDPTSQDWVVDNIYSPLDSNSVELQALPSDGTRIYAVGEIAVSASTQVVTLDDSSPVSVDDTDRFTLDLSDRTGGEVIEVGIWLERRFEDTDGNPAPFDPWVGAAPQSWVPTPTVTTLTSALCTESEESFGYPTSVLPYMYYQEFLSSSVGVDSEDPCGAPYVDSGDLTCNDDFDGDNVADDEEPIPDGFIAQIQVRQCELGVDSSEYYNNDWIDKDEIDDGDQLTYDPVGNVGGDSGGSGEEAYLSLTLAGGETYTIVVSGGGDEGVYELSARQTN